MKPWHYAALAALAYYLWRQRAAAVVKSAPGIVPGHSGTAYDAGFS